MILINPVIAGSTPLAAPLPSLTVPVERSYVVLAQAGSSGGVIGKRGRSVSGSETVTKRPSVKTRSLATKTRAVRRAAPAPRKATRTSVRARSGRCISARLAGYSGRVCY
jgi:hypothetical protein